MHRPRFLRSGIPATHVLAAFALPIAGVLAAAPPAPVTAAEPSTAPPLVRKNAADLTPAERARFVAAVKALKHIPSPYDPSVNAYDYYVLLHEDAYDDHASGAHMSSAFLPWHRFLRRRSRLIPAGGQVFSRTGPCLLVCLAVAGEHAHPG